MKIKVNDQVKNPAAEIEIPAFFADAVSFTDEPETLAVTHIFENRVSNEGTRYQKSVDESSDLDAHVVLAGPVSPRRYRLGDLHKA